MDDRGRVWFAFHHVFFDGIVWAFNSGRVERDFSRVSDGLFKRRVVCKTMDLEACWRERIQQAEALLIRRRSRGGRQGGPRQDDSFRPAGRQDEPDGGPAQGVSLSSREEHRSRQDVCGLLANKVKWSPSKTAMTVELEEG